MRRHGYENRLRPYRKSLTPLKPVSLLRVRLHCVGHNDDSVRSKANLLRGDLGRVGVGNAPRHILNGDPLYDPRKSVDSGVPLAPNTDPGTTCPPDSPRIYVWTKGVGQHDLRTKVPEGSPEQDET